jgi:ABC-type glycerol-3-phosphate transport system substrate-binding protein
MDRPRPRAGAAWLLAAGLALAGCATPPAAEPELQPPAAAATECPATLAYVRPKLVTPPADLEAFIGKDELAETFNQPVDEMIAKGGGIERSLVGAQRNLDEYKKIVAASDQVRHDYHAAGETDQWIETYLSSVKDGITINQGFVDATLCRQRRAGAAAKTI